ncbi:MAG TPA: TolC family protein [Ignavibacteria bacterium]|nr:TolC family protein [Ignavibacteria bacterium]
MKIKNIVIIALFVFTFININYAQEKLSLNLEQSINLGLKNSYTLHSSKMGVLAAEAKLKEVNTFRLPILDFAASYTRLSKVNPFTITTPFGVFNISPTFFDVYNFKVSLKQPLFTGFKLKSTSEIAEFNSLAAKQDYTKEEKDLIFNIKNSYWNLFKAEKIKKVVNENVGQIKAHLKDVKNLFDQGLATRNDVLKVQVQLAEAKLRQIDAKNAVQLSMVNLDNILVLPLSTEINITEIPSREKQKTQDLSELLQTAYKNRADLKAMNYRINASKKGINLAKSDWFPQVYLSSNYYYSNPNRRILPTRNKFYGTWDVSLSLSFNLWNWGATGDRTTQAKMQYEQTKDFYASLKDVIKLQVTRSYLNVKKALEKMKVAKKSVKEAEENYRVTEDKFENGLVINSELLDAEVALLQSKTNNIQAIVDYNLALASLNKSIGN